jgi:glucose-1-phosphate thymidylyltransferase
LTTSPGEVIGVAPAAGRAERLGRLQGSKEVLPVWRPAGLSADRPPLPACACLLSAFGQAGIPRALFLIRREKEDIPERLGSATELGTRLDYVLVDDSPAPPFTVDAAFDAIDGRVVALGFPDILFEPADAFVPLLHRLRSTSADAVLGLFPHPATRRADRVAMSPDGVVLSIRPSALDSRPGGLTWGLAVWRPRFTRFLHEQVDGLDRSAPDVSRLGIGHVLDAAIRAGLVVLGKSVSDEAFLDIGTPSALAEARRRAAGPAE